MSTNLATRDPSEAPAPSEVNPGPSARPLRRRRWWPWAITGLTVLVAAASMVTTLAGELRGNFAWHILPAEMFGVPQDLAARGLEPLYRGPVQTGWDGQFYYYIANDLLGTKDTLEHIDSDAYRYQRVGLPLLAKLLSVVTFQSWVSPFTYYLTSLLLLLAATLALSRFLVSEDLPAWPVLLWSLNAGTQITLVSGLPDCAADSLLILAVLALLRQRWVWFAVAAAFASLSREIYVLLPFVVFVQTAVSILRGSGFRALWTRASLARLLTLASPGIVFAGWQAFIRLKMGSPQAQSKGVLDSVPFRHWAKQLINTSADFHWGATEPVLLVAFLAAWIAAVWAGWTALRAPVDRQRTPRQAIAVTVLALAASYAFFGWIVMFHWTGYLKAATLFFFAPPLLFALQGRRMPAAVLAVLTVTMGLGSVAFAARMRSAVPSTLTSPGPGTEYGACLSELKGTIRLVGIGDTARDPRYRALLGREPIIQYDLEVTNTSSVAWPPASVLALKAGFQWLDRDGKLISEGRGSSIPRTIAPGESVVLPTPVVGRHRGSTLRLGFLQEGCFWLHDASPEGQLLLKAL